MHVFKSLSLFLCIPFFLLHSSFHKIHIALCAFLISFLRYFFWYAFSIGPIAQNKYPINADIITVRFSYWFYAECSIFLLHLCFSLFVSSFRVTIILFLLMLFQSFRLSCSHARARSRSLPLSFFIFCPWLQFCYLLHCKKKFFFPKPSRYEQQRSYGKCVESKGNGAIAKHTHTFAPGEHRSFTKRILSQILLMLYSFVFMIANVFSLFIMIAHRKLEITKINTITVRV